MDRITALRAVARNLADLVVDTIPASMTGSFVDATRLIFPETNQLRGMDFYIYSGAGAGQQRTVASYTPANRRVGFSESFSPVPSTNSNFILLKRFRKDEYDNALDRMEGLARELNLQEMVGTIQIIGTRYEYAVPSGMEYINTVRIVPSGGTDYSDYEADDFSNRIFELPAQYWRIEANPAGSYYLSFDSRKISLDDMDGDTFRIMGQAKPAITATDNATINRDIEEFVISGATAL